MASATSSVTRAGQLLCDLPGGSVSFSKNGDAETASCSKQPGTDPGPLFGVGGYLRLSVIDPQLEAGRGLEHHCPPRRDRHLLTSLGIAANALAFFADDKRTE
jgi:hypothetical protein